jgi:hypothetical protein
MGRHIFDASAQDHWPDFQGANEAAVEQVELTKAAPSRSRPSSSRAGECTWPCTVAAFSATYSTALELFLSGIPEI